MIVDTSAIIAILTEEQDSVHFFRLLKAAGAPVMSSATRVELSAVSVRKRLPATEDMLDELLAEFNIAVVAVSARHADLACAAYRRYGRGSKHPAKLNFGDCFPYALARERNEPLLFKGDDFRHTDVRAAA